MKIGATLDALLIFGKSGGLKDIFIRFTGVRGALGDQRWTEGDQKNLPGPKVLKYVSHLMPTDIREIRWFRGTIRRFMWAPYVVKYEPMGR